MKNTPTILIIDDDNDDVELFKEALASLAPAAECISKNDGKEGLDFLMSKKNIFPDLIFLDLNMPRVDGVQCLKEIKRNKHLSNIPVIIYTTSRQNEDEKEIKKLGAAEFITKPSSFEDICAVIENILKKYQVGSTSHDR